VRDGAVPCFRLPVDEFSFSWQCASQMDLSVVALLLECIVLCACASLCASAIFIPNYHSPPQEDVP